MERPARKDVLISAMTSIALSYDKHSTGNPRPAQLHVLVKNHANSIPACLTSMHHVLVTHLYAISELQTVSSKIERFTTVETLSLDLKTVE